MAQYLPKQWTTRPTRNINSYTNTSNITVQSPQSFVRGKMDYCCRRNEPVPASEWEWENGIRQEQSPILLAFNPFFPAIYAIASCLGLCLSFCLMLNRYTLQSNCAKYLNIKSVINSFLCFVLNFMSCLMIVVSINIIQNIFELKFKMFEILFVNHCEIV